MKKEHQKRLSLIDGSIEHVQTTEGPEAHKKLEPLYEETVVKILTLEGEEETVRKRLVGFSERNK